MSFTVQLIFQIIVLNFDELICFKELRKRFRIYDFNNSVKLFINDYLDNRPGLLYSKYYEYQWSSKNLKVWIIFINFNQIFNNSTMIRSRYYKMLTKLN